MIESSPSASGEETAQGREELLVTKLTIPRLRPQYLVRSRLVDRVEEAMTQSLVLVCTPAGFGKTTLLADWAHHCAWPVGWLSLDQDDNDPVRFWRYLVEALDRVVPDLRQELLPLLTAPRVSIQAVVTAAINRLETLDEEVVQILDDYHLVESPPIHDSLNYLLDHAPPQLHLVIASRSDPPLLLARFRAGGLMGELRASHLRFTTEETASFLQELWGLALSPQAVASLESRTEGWAVGLQLAALSLRGRSDSEQFLEAFSGTHRFVLDYLTEEVLERQPEGLRTFMLETSVLDRMCGPLCDAVTGRRDCQDMLEELDRANLFLVALDEERRWYRYHHLFADLLGGRLHESHPDLVPELHRRAAGWCESQGLVDQAIRHALAAGDTAWASRLVERHVEELLLRRSERVTLDRWLASLPAETVATKPRLVLAQAIAARAEGRLDEGERFLAAAQEAPAEPEEPHEPSVGRAASVLTNVPAVTSIALADIALMTGEPEEAAASAREALSLLSPKDWMLGTFVRYHLAMAEWMLGRLEPAAEGLSRVADERAAAGEGYPAIRAICDLGLVQRAAGQLGTALETYRRGLEIMTEPDGRHRPEAGLALVGIAEVMRQRGDLRSALRHATEGIEGCRQVLYTPPLAAGLVTLAWIHQAMAEPARALEAMEEAQGAVPSPRVVALVNPAPTEQVRLWLAQGRVEEAARWVEERDLRDEDDVSYPLEPDYLLLARVVVALGEPGRALALLQRLDVRADAQGRTGSLIRIRALRSLALQAVGDHEGALSMLAGALSLARPQGYLRVFADEGRPMAALLRSLATSVQRGRVSFTGRARQHLARVVAAFEPSEDDAPKRGEVPGLIVPLTDRELEVLELLAAGRRNRDIAEELVVSLWTVKKHVSHILDKLGVASRTEAVAHARQLGLLP